MPSDCSSSSRNSSSSKQADEASWRAYRQTPTPTQRKVLQRHATDAARLSSPARPTATTQQRVTRRHLSSRSTLPGWARPTALPATSRRAGTRPTCRRCMQRSAERGCEVDCDRSSLTPPPCAQFSHICRNHELGAAAVAAAMVHAAASVAVMAHPALPLVKQRRRSCIRVLFPATSRARRATLHRQTQLMM